MTIVKLMGFCHASAFRASAAQLVTHFTRAGVDLLFPPRCVLCGGCGVDFPVGQTTDWKVCPTGCKVCPTSEATPLCPPCAATVEREQSSPACPRCAASVAPYEVSNGRCGKCRNHHRRIAGTVRIGPYRLGADLTGLGRLLRSYKYHAREELGPVLGGWLAEVVARAPWLDRVEAIVSVPTHWKRRLTRPLYPPDALASLVTEKTGLPRLPLLRRVRAGPHQIGLNNSERIENVRGAFAVRREVTLRDARLLLIDDVKTTGATINECAKVLRRGGASQVYAAVVIAAGGDRSTGQALPPI